MVSGVPQGSILGPLFFLVFVNDLPEVIRHSLFLLFADDAKCARQICSQSDSSELQEDLDSLCEWSVVWKLKFKVPKCVLLRCCTHGAAIESTYTLNDNEVSVREVHHDLGVIISSDLSFGPL